MTDISNQVVSYFSDKVVPLNPNATVEEIRLAVEKTFGLRVKSQTQTEWIDNLTVAMGWKKGLVIYPFEVIAKLWPNVPQISSRLFFGGGGQFMGGGGLTKDEKELVGL